MSRARATAGVLACGLIAACGAGVATGGAASNAEACGACHVVEHAAWAASGQASSTSSPVFVALSARAGLAWGSAAQARCVACHQPGFAGDHGIGCVACHAAMGNLETRDGLLVVDTDAPLSGSFANPSPDAPHATRVYGFLVAPELCATCHQVTGPGLLHETTFDEYLSSSAGKQGAGCVSCHMPALAPGPVAPLGEAARPRADHAFIGFDPLWGASETDAAAATERTRQLLASGLTLSVSRSSAGIVVSLTNLAGHAVPTGAAALRRIWVDVAFAGADGQQIERTAVIDLRAQPTRAGAPVALITDADAVDVRTLQPGATRSISVDTPAQLTAPIQATARLRATAIRPEILSALGLDALSAQVPQHEIATASTQ